jgi:hypothetical protein
MQQQEKIKNNEPVKKLADRTGQLQYQSLPGNSVTIG